MKYRILEKGEIVQHGDETDSSPDGWRDEPCWVPATKSVGEEAPDPAFPSHRVFRRPIAQENEAVNEFCT